MDIIVQIVLVIVTTATSYFILKEIAGSTLWRCWCYSGLALGYVIIKLEDELKDISLKIIFGGLVGVMMSLMVAHLFISRLLLALVKDIPITLPIYILFYFIIGYLGFTIGKEKSKTLIFPRCRSSTMDASEESTSSIRAPSLTEELQISAIPVLLKEHHHPPVVLYEIQHIVDHQGPG